MTFHLQIAAEGERSLRLVRRFAAPLPVVWRAFTEPGLLTQWLWTEDHRMTRCDQDFRPGGEFRWCWAMTGGGSTGVSGRYHEIVPLAHFRHSAAFDHDRRGRETAVTTSFCSDGDQTVMEMRLDYPSGRARDRAAGSPMAAGLEEGYARLANLLPGWS